MKINISISRILYISILVTTIGLLNACKEDDLSYNNVSPKPSVVFYALTSSSTTVPSSIIQYNSSNTSVAITAPIAITGMQTGESMLAIDVRPKDSIMYGISNASRIYKFTKANGLFTGVVTLVGTGPTNPAISGTVAAFDFNPVADRLRVVTSTGQNLRINPVDATVTVDGAINGINDARVTGAGYTNNVNSATSTELFDLDIAAQKLYKQDANAGTLTEVGLTGLAPIINIGNPSFSAAYNTNITSFRNNAAAGFDISSKGIALALMNINSAPAIPVGGLGANNPSRAINAVPGTLYLFQINTATGRATELGLMAIPAASNSLPASSLIGIAILP